MYQVHFSKAYKKSIKKLVKNGKVKLVDVDVVIDLIVCGTVLPIKYRDHKYMESMKGTENVTYKGICCWYIK